MAKREHLKILKQGVKVWNKWIEERPMLDPDLDGADLSELNLSEANLSGASLSHTVFFNSKLINANLSGAYLFATNFTHADLGYADLSNTILIFTNFHFSQLRKAIFNHANIGSVAIAETDMTDALGLETCSHLGPSSIDHRTLIKSGNLPLSFLRGCGLPDTLIKYLPSLLNDPIQFYSCFISYSSKNYIFVNRLYADLQNKGVRCWLASEDLKIGAEIRIGIDESIRVHDKLLLVLSKHSVASEWVEQEVETALDRERREKRTVLFPIRLDDTVMKIDTGWPALIKNTRNIGDFRKWRNPEAYSKAFDRLLRDLKAEEK